MKKGIIVLLITVLAAGMVFADFSGDAYIQFNADLDNKSYGLYNGADFGFAFAVDSEVANISGENPIHVEVEATADLIFANNYQAYTGDEGTKYGTLVWANDGGLYGVGILFDLSTAKIAGENWSIDITGAKSSAYDYAKASSLKKYTNVYDSFGNAYDKTKTAASYKVSYNSYFDGITATYDGFTVSFGFKNISEATVDADDKAVKKAYGDTEKTELVAGTAYVATLETKEFAFADDMIKIQAATEVSKILPTETIKSPLTNVGASAKVAFAKDEISAKAAADFGFEGIGGDKVNVQFDASLAAAYNFVSATAYVFKGDGLKYTDGTYKDFYLEATLGVDLSKFDVPVSVSFAAKNIIDKNDAGIGLSASAKYSAEAITAGASFGLSTKTSEWTLNGYGIYSAEKFSAGANVYYASAKKAVSFGAFAESSALVEGVTLGLSYGLKGCVTSLDYDYVLYGGGAYCVANAKNNNSFSSDSKTLGTVEAYCIINF